MTCTLHTLFLQETRGTKKYLILTKSSLLIIFEKSEFTSPLSDDHVVELRTEQENWEILTCSDHISMAIPHEVVLSAPSAWKLGWNCAAPLKQQKLASLSGVQIQPFKFNRQTIKVWNSQNMAVQSHSSQTNLPSTDTGTSPHFPAKTQNVRAECC